MLNHTLNGLQMPRHSTTLGLFIFMEQETYDDLLWEIGDIPVASCTPDEFYELSFRATSECPDCGAELNGLAQYWSRDADMSNSWLDRIEHEPCNCQSAEDDLSDFDE